MGFIHYIRYNGFRCNGILLYKSYIISDFNICRSDDFLIRNVPSFASLDLISDFKEKHNHFFVDKKKFLTCDDRPIFGFPY